MPQYFINFLLFTLPLVIIPVGSSQFEIPKVIIGIAAIDCLFLFTLVKNGQKFFSSLNKIQLVLIAFLVLLTIYDLFTYHNTTIFLGNQFRLQGILLVWHLFLLSILSSYYSYKRLPFYAYAVFFILTLATSLLFGNANDRSVGTLGEPNALAAWVVFLTPFLYFAPDLPKRYAILIRVAVIILSLFIIFLSGSRSGLIAFSLCLFFLFVFKICHNLKLAMIFATLLFITVYFLPGLEQVKYENRSVIWHTAYTAGFLHPILGGGFGIIETQLRTVIVHEHNSLIGYRIDSSHNIFLDWWVQGGFVGLLLFGSLLFFAIKNFYQKKQILNLVLLFGLLTSLSFNPASVVSLIGLWWLIGQGFIPEKLHKK